MKKYEKWKKSEGYQGIALEVAKSMLEQLENAPAAEKNKVRRDAESILKDMVRIPSEYHDEANKLFNEMRGKGSGGGATANTPEEAIANGDDSMKDQKWQDAITWYEKAREMAKKASSGEQKKTLLNSIREKLETCRYNEIYMIYAAKPENDAAEAKNESEALQKIADLTGTDNLNPKGEIAAKLATLRVYIILKRYGKATDQKDKAELLEQLQTAAKKVIDGWPDKSTADDARIALAQASMVQGKTQEGVEQLENVNPRSEQYGKALYMAAQGHLRLWKSEKDKEAGKAEAQKAINDLEKSVEIQAKAAQGGQASQQLMEAQLIMGQVYMELNEPQKAAAVLQPMVDSVKAHKPERLDPTMVKLFNTAVRASVATGDMARGGETATLLVELGDDNPDVNNVLFTFAKMVDHEYKEAVAANLNAKTENKIIEIDATEKRLAGMTELLGILVEKLAPRENLSPIAMLSLGDIALQINKIELASGIYNRVLTKAAADANFASQCGKNGLIRARAQLVDLLGKTGKYKEGVEEADKLIDEAPKTLEPLMTKGRLLQAWAEQDASKFPDAVSHWSSLRATLGAVKKRPPEYYEVNLNVARCLLKEAKQNKDPSKASVARQVLNAPMITSPTLNGPDTVARYKELDKQCETFIEKGK